MPKVRYCIILHMSKTCLPCFSHEYLYLGARGIFPYLAALRGLVLQQGRLGCGGERGHRRGRAAGVVFGREP